MIFRQITHDDLGCASYLVGGGGVAAVVDPRFEIDDYLELARYMNVQIEHVLETHNHADHVSGHGRLAAATGATTSLLRAGREWIWDNATIRVLHPPEPDWERPRIRNDDSVRTAVDNLRRRLGRPPS